MLRYKQLRRENEIGHLWEGGHQVAQNVLKHLVLEFLKIFKIDYKLLSLRNKRSTKGHRN